ncbi:uncharacterized protein TrAtP1_005391 [Trichoderma atroviride]|uniref:uncharacterized protein n=1 Tax=Hypocrea atroviridis TaxID=63577 RepID=UPI0033175DA1|nr:hypothetical protein TrAtP1_005391 [Trichoderma atroviride]
MHASSKLKDPGYSEGSFLIECFYIHFDGTQFGPVNRTFQIASFQGERKITSLPVIPLKCFPDQKNIKEKLRQRGKKFAELSNPKSTSHREYKGLTLDKNVEQVDSEVIIDFELAFIQKPETKPVLGLEGRLVSDDSREFADSAIMGTLCGRAGCCGNDAIFNDYIVDEHEYNTFREGNRALFDSVPVHSADLSDDQMILLPPQVYGFVLRTRRWATFDIDLLTNPTYGNEWDNLVINQDNKKMILALVENHERPRDTQTRTGGVLPSVDLIQGKGRGLIILLHGEPGVGKTSTAECVAAHTKRPLFPITCGDIGDKAETVERNLEKNFQLAHKWGCVMLLDEADIFLGARTGNDIERNAIVSVFLRSVEYYSGILFLTTNRVGTMDRAFKSRIHVSLFYKKFNLKRTIAVWENNIERIKKEFNGQGKKIEIDSEEIMAFAKAHFKELHDTENLTVWNGRQIRNAFQTAIAMATHEAKNPRTGSLEARPRLRERHFKEVAKIAEDFERYLVKATHLSDMDMAESRRERYDRYQQRSNRDREHGRRRRDESKNRKRNHHESRDYSDSDSSGSSRKKTKNHDNTSDSD